MDGEVKVYLTAVTVILAACVGWLLFRETVVSNQRDAADGVAGALERTGAEQQRAAESAERVRDGLDRSVVILERIEERTGNAADAVGRATSRNEATLRIVEDSERRITESKRILQSVREGTRKD